MSVVTAKLEKIEEHYIEMRDIQTPLSLEYKAYDRVIRVCYSVRGKSLENQRKAVLAFIHRLEQEGLTRGLYIDVIRSFKTYLSKTGKLVKERQTA